MTYSGIVEGLSNELYHAHSAISSTPLKKMSTGTPAHVMSHLESDEKLESEALLRGSVLHSMLLEPNTVNDTYIFERHYLKDKNRLSKNGGSKEQWDYLKEISEITGKPLVKFEIYHACQAMREKVKSHPFWPRVHNEAKKEVSIFSQINGVSVKARPDAILDDIIIDLKTSKDLLTNSNIQKTIVKLGYHFSAAMYLEVAKSQGINAKRFIWVFVENTSPFECRFVEASSEMLKTGRAEFYRCLNKFKECLSLDDFHGYPVEIEELDLPLWYSVPDYNESSLEDDEQEEGGEDFYE